MRPSLIWSDDARDDLFEIYGTICADNPAAAERVFTAIEDYITLLAAHPRLGVRRPDIYPSARMLVQGVYLIFYRTDPDTDDGPIDEVKIVRIVHGHRDLSYIF
jgi:toxin ParE1/3/4